MFRDPQQLLAEVFHTSWTVSNDARRRHAPVDVVRAALELAPERTAELVRTYKQLPPELADALAAHPDAEVRHALARRRFLRRRPDLLERLAEDPDPEVRCAVVEHEATPEAIRRALQRDPNPGVAYAAHVALGEEDRFDVDAARAAHPELFEDPGRDPFPDWVEEVAGDAIHFDPEDLWDEFLSNRWTFGVSSAQAARLSVADVVAFLDAVVEARAAALRERHGGHPMLLYVYFDDDNLCLCVVSTSHGRLSFSAPVRVHEGPEAVVEAFLASPNHDGRTVHLVEEEAPAAGDQEEDEPEVIADAWVVLLPEGARRGGVRLDPEVRDLQGRVASE